MKRDSSVKNIDHRDLGKKHKLFLFDEAGPGFPFWLENGLILKNSLIQYWREKHIEEGYSEIESPMMLDRILWEQSGHWDLFQENMYQSKVDKRDFAIKPMSCPGAVLVYRSQKRSYRELPLRLSEMGHVHRNEPSGSLQGLLRVRSFIQDDAHIFCRENQLQSEIMKVLSMCEEILGHCGFKKFHFEIAVRGKSEKYLGRDEDWKIAEKSLVKALKEKNFDYVIKDGEAKFYGPSIDLHIEDSRGRFWQCSSIQLDFNLPKRFDLKFVNEKGESEVPFMLHRAIFGSLERFIGILLENFGMELPFWLAPEQVRVISVDGSSENFCRELIHKLRRQGLRVGEDLRDENLKVKIKNQVQEKVPLRLVIGKKEMEKGVLKLEIPNGENIEIKNLKV